MVVQTFDTTIDMPSTTCFTPDEEEEIDIMNHSGEDEPISDFPLCDTLPSPDTDIMSAMHESPLKYNIYVTKQKGSYSKLKIRPPSSNQSGGESSENSEDDTRYVFTPSDALCRNSSMSQGLH
jgi:hypothetical protein